jgi:hypothetical protein
MDTGLQPHHINPISINKAAPKKIKRCDLEVGGDVWQEEL